ncbi:hypothetical protein Kim5_CH02795 [Rhizobium sp. Kim5]|nr:hypothetical protein Kim5_CH02795 [Rhizobium sp. Kim5]
MRRTDESHCSRCATSGIAIRQFNQTMSAPADLTLRGSEAHARESGLEYAENGGPALGPASELAKK